MIEFQRYARKPFYVEAIRVTRDNLEDVATWCHGDVQTDNWGRHVKVRVHRPLNDRQTKAYPGDWVLYAGTGFKVYTDKAFQKSFEPAENKVEELLTTNEPAENKVEELLTTNEPE